MPKYRRVPGGEKNENSGKKYSKYELRFVRDLFLSMRDGVGVHEHNPEVILLGKKLNRTRRSIEGQLHMFKNIRKDGNHGWHKMSMNCKAVWQEYLETIK